MNHFCHGYLIALMVIVACAGCANLQPTPPDKSKTRLPVPRMQSDTVVLEIAVAQLDVSQKEAFESFWRQLDSQKLDLNIRKRADQNGLRMGTIASSVPASLQRILEPQELDPEKLNEWETQLNEKGYLQPVERLVLHQRIQNRDGQTHEVQISSVHDQVGWIVHDGDKVTPGTGKSAVGGFQIKSYQNSDGSVRLVLMPQIQHGQSRPRIGLSDGSFTIEPGRATHQVDSLKTEVELLSGETLIVAPTSDAADLGGVIFSPSPKSSLAERDGLFRILMVRLIQTQTDDLFQKQEKMERLSSVPDF